MINKIREDLRKVANEEKAKFYPRFFKTGKGEYGEGDQFLGVTVPDSRKVARKYINLPLNQVIKLLKSSYHEERFVALVILTLKYEKGAENEKKQIVDLYLDNTKYINNWDLVDVSSYKIIGEYLIDKTRDLLSKLANSNLVWERRIAIISTFAFIKKNREYKDTFKISEILLKDRHDLIHKAVGWMLREVGEKVSQDKLVEFLEMHYKEMPRTMLRYSLEKLSRELKSKFMSK